MFWALAVRSCSLGRASQLWYARTDRARCRRRRTLLAASICDQLKGFVYVGAGALALLAIAVIRWACSRTGRSAEGLAVLGFFGYAVYLVAATVVLYVMSRKS